MEQIMENLKDPGVRREMQRELDKINEEDASERRRRLQAQITPRLNPISRAVKIALRGG